MTSSELAFVSRKLYIIFHIVGFFLIQVPYATVEKQKQIVQVLCGGLKFWEKSKLDKKRHFPGGKSATGEIYFVCQVEIDSNTAIPGNFKESSESCCYPYLGLEICSKKCLMLINNS